MFDPEESVPYARIPYEINDCKEHRQLALRTARESVVLLKNEDNLLPLSKDINSIAVIGPNAHYLDVLLGNYNGWPSEYTTPLDGIRGKLSPDTRLFYAKGCELLGNPTHGFSEAVSAAERSDVVVMALGLSPAIEGEEGDAYNSDAAGDRTHLDLTGAQQQLLEKVVAVGKPVVLVLISGSALAVTWADENVPAIIQSFYPGEEGGTAIADVIFGDYSPAGRLPVTYVRSLEDLPPFEDYNMKGRTYRYIGKDPLYPFGFGLSYTKFDYTAPKLSADTVKAGDSLEVSVRVKNSGKVAGDEVVQLYLSDVEASVAVPVRKLAGFKRISLAPGESKDVALTITPEQMAIIDNDGNPVLEPGEFRISIGGSQGDERSLTLGAAPVQTAAFNMV
jgi:beta-glucosidase